MFPDSVYLNIAPELPMNNKNEIEHLLHKYFNNESSQQELKIINHWLSNPANQDEFNKILDYYIKSKNIEVPSHISRINSWENITRKISEDEKEWIHERNAGWRSMGKIAAVIILLIIGTIAFINQDKIFKGPEEIPEQLAAIVKHTENGQKRIINLPDGSKVTLNSASTLEISSDFMQDNSRIVSLKGEAFFEVENMPEKPFLVKTEKITTRVLGTSFNVEAYQTDKIKVAVNTGKVQVANSEGSVDLVTDEMAIYNEQDGIIKTHFDPMLEFGWKDGYLIFDQADFKTMVNKLERWYGVNIIVKGEMPLDTFSVKYHNESLETVLEGLSFSGNFEYQLKEKMLTIKFN